MNEYIIDIRDLTYKVNDVTMLDNISFKLRQGDNLTVFGPEGSGITSLFDIIVKADPNFQGEAYYKGESIKKLDYFGQLLYKKDIGYVHGDYGLLSNMTVEQNISLPLEYHSKLTAAEIKKQADKVIYELNLDHCKKFRPIDLTRSEILKTAFARAIVMDPDMLYIEHAFEDQCPLNIKTMMDILIERSKIPDKSLIIITYFPRHFIDVSEYFIMFFNGRVVFDGSNEEFQKTDNPYVLQYLNNSIEGPMVIL